MIEEKEVQIINFIELDIKKKKEVLFWRNSEEISKWMLTKNISLKDHLKFIEKLKKIIKIYIF